MTSLERVFNTLGGKPCDRPPVFAVLSAYGARLSGDNLKDLYSNVDTYVNSQTMVQETFSLDLVLAPFDYSILGEAFGCEVSWFADQVPNIRKPIADNADDALTLSLPNLALTGRLPFMLSATKKLVDKFSGTVPVFAAIPGPVILPSLIMGMEAWINTFLFETEKAQRILSHLAVFWLSYAKALQNAGVTALIITEGMATSQIATRALFQDYCLPHLQTCFSKLDCPKVLHSTGGSVTHVLDLLGDLPGLLGLVIGSKDSLVETRQKMGPNILLLGNLDNLTFPRSNEDDMYTRATSCLSENRKRGPYIISNSGADLPLSTPPTAIHALRRAAEAYGKLNHATG